MGGEHVSDALSSLAETSRCSVDSVTCCLPAIHRAGQKETHTVGRTAKQEGNCPGDLGNLQLFTLQRTPLWEDSLSGAQGLEKATGVPGPSSAEETTCLIHPSPQPSQQKPGMERGCPGKAWRILLSNGMDPGVDPIIYMGDPPGLREETATPPTGR